MQLFWCKTVWRNQRGRAAQRGRRLHLHHSLQSRLRAGVDHQPYAPYHQSLGKGFDQCQVCTRETFESIKILRYKSAVHYIWTLIDCICASTGPCRHTTGCSTPGKIPRGRGSWSGRTATAKRSRIIFAR